MNALNDKLLEIVLPLYNDWLETVKMSEYSLYPNNEEGIELMAQQKYMNSTMDFVNDIACTSSYMPTDRVITHNYEQGFRSLDDNELLELLENKDFNKWLKEGAKL